MFVDGQNHAIVFVGTKDVVCHEFIPKEQTVTGLFLRENAINIDSKVKPSGPRHSRTLIATS